MPITIQGNTSNPNNTGRFKASGIRRGEFRDDYKHLYPEGLDLSPGSSIHEYIVNQVLNRASESERRMTVRHDKWREVDEMLHVFTNLNQEEKDIQKLDPRKPVSIVIPESYAIRETILTYLLAAFGTDPMWKFRGVGPEDTMGAILLEHVQQNQVHRSNVLLNLHTLWSDGLTYGFGAATPIWTVEEGVKVVANELGFFDTNQQFIRTGMERTLEDAVLFEGNRLDNIDPYRFLPDPALGIHEVQDAGYVGWLDTSIYETLRASELERDSFLFNVQYLRDTSSSSSIYRHDHSGRDSKKLSTDRGDKRGSESQSVDTIYMYIDLIPSEWRDRTDKKLADRDSPETWLFALAGDNIIISAHKVERMHKKFPVVTCVPDFDGHTASPVSRLELIHGLMISTNFLHNSHQYAIMKSLRNQLIVDPKGVNMRDVMAQNGIIRTRRANWGRGVKDLVQQLKVDDLTKNMPNDIEFNRQTANNVSGAQDHIQGLVRQGGERVTATEVNSTRSAALSRLQKTARIISMQCHQDIGIFFAKNTQLFMSEETFIQTVGRHQEDLMREYGYDQTGFVPVSPFELSIDFDIEIHDGSIEDTQHIQTWAQIYQMVTQNQEVNSEIDPTRVFLHLARLMGADNVQDFRRPQQPADVQVGTDEEVLALAEQEGLSAL